MQNILYETNEINSLKETLDDNLKSNILDEDQVLAMDNQDTNPFDDGFNLLWHLDENFEEMNVKDLKQISKFYALSTNRLRKKTIIEQLIKYEMNEQHFHIVEKRRRYWQYMYELLNDQYMSSYIHNFS